MGNPFDKFDAKPMKIAFVGAPGVGKSLLARDVGNELSLKGFNTFFVPEYAAVYILRYGPVEYIWEQIMIMHQQVRREEYYPKGCEFIVCDCASFLTYVYARMMYSQPKRQVISRETRIKLDALLDKLHKWVQQELLSYNKIFFIPKEFEMAKDGIRVQTDRDAQEISEGIEAFLKLEGINYHIIKGSPEERTKQVFEALKLPEVV